MVCQCLLRVADSTGRCNTCGKSFCRARRMVRLRLRCCSNSFFSAPRTRKLAQQDPICQRLMSAPGAGFVTALTFKAAVDDPNRFKRSRTVAAHFGLTPRRYQSGEMDNPGRISRAGDRRASSYDLDTTSTSTGTSRRARGLDEAEYVCCASKHVQKRGSPNRPTNACSG